MKPFPEKKKRLRKIERLPALTKEEWEALPSRPHLYYDGKMVEMTWDQQVGAYSAVKPPVHGERE